MFFESSSFASISLLTQSLFAGFNVVGGPAISARDVSFCFSFSWGVVTSLKLELFLDNRQRLIPFIQ